MSHDDLKYCQRKARCTNGQERELRNCPPPITTCVPAPPNSNRNRDAHTMSNQLLSRFIHRLHVACALLLL